MKEENTKTMSSSRSYGSSQVITNILLLLVLAAISAFGIDQRLHAQDGRGWAENLRNEGRRQLFANYFAEQVLKNKAYSKKDLKELLAQGTAGINSYISLNEDELIVAIRESARTGLYGWQVLMADDIYSYIYGSEFNKIKTIKSTTKGEEK